MLHPHLNGLHDPWIVLLAIALGVLASYTALDVGGRIKAARGKQQIVWLALGATTMGGGIWSMHFVAMLAFRLDTPISFDVVLTVGSLLAAILVTGIALFIASAGKLDLKRLLTGGTIMGLGIAAMHYVGMAAMRLAAEIRYDAILVMVSIAIAIMAATVALWLAFTTERLWQKLVAAMVMGVAIAGMHFTGMMATTFQPHAVPTLYGRSGLSHEVLAVAVATATVFILCLTLQSSITHRLWRARAARRVPSLRESERFHLSLVQNSSYVIGVLDDEGAFTDCSKSVYHVLGHAAAWMIGRKLVEFIAKEDAARFEALMACAEPGGAEPSEFRVRHADGEWRACELTCSDFRRDPAVGGIVLNLHDTTDRQRVMDELRKAKDLAEQANRTKSEFLAAVSHELRTPLNAVIGFSEVIKSGMLGDEAGPRCIDYATHIHDSAGNLLRVINDILDLSKAESGQMTLSEDHCRITDIVAAVCRAMQPQADAAKVAVVPILPAYMPHLYGDRRRLQQAIENILSNAVKFSPAGGRVEIATRIDDEAAIVVTVKDTGIGMTAEQITMALEPFRQVDGRLSRRYDGIGLGLPLAKRLVELHGGSVTIDSTPSAGTCVVLRLPANRVVWSETASATGT